MYCKRTLLAAACLLACSCARRASGPGVERLAILRFENLSSDPSIDWMGRALSEITTRDLMAAPGLYTIPFDRLHRSDAAFGARPLQAPGVSAERAIALSAGATRLGYGEYWRRNGRVEARLTLEDSSGRMAQVLTASAPDSDPVGLAGALARQVSSRASSYPAAKSAALEQYVAALEAPDLNARGLRLQEAINADANFAPPYALLAQVKLQQQDRAGAQAVLQEGLKRQSAFPAIDRVRLQFDAAQLSGDGRAAGRLLAEWTRIDPNDPAVWTTIGQISMSHHDYQQAKQAYQRAAALEPDDANLLNQLGYASAYAGDLTAATEALRRYAALRPADVNPYDSLGDVNLILGQLKDAANFYQQAAKKDPAFLNGGEFYKTAIALLMSGDTKAADSAFQQFLDAHAAAKDPVVDLRRAEWAWITGRRKDAQQAVAAFANAAESGPLREAASQAYAQLAVWNVALGDRAAAAQTAAKAVALAGPGSAGLPILARFLSQPSASAAEWAARAAQSFPPQAQRQLKDIALVYALLADRHYPEAAAALQPIYDNTSPITDDTLPVLLAWADLETGKPKEAAALLRFNPLPGNSGVKPFTVFYFPRLFELRAKVAGLAGDAAQQRAQLALFRQLETGDRRN